MDKLKALKREAIITYWIGLLSIALCIIMVTLFLYVFPYKIAFIFSVITAIFTFCFMSYFFVDASKIENEIEKLSTLLKIPLEFSEVPIKDSQNIIDGDLRKRYLKGPIFAKRISDDYEHIIIKYVLRSNDNVIKQIPFKESRKIFDYDAYNSCKKGDT